MLFAVAKQCAHEAQNVGHDRDSAVPAEDAGSIQAATEAEEDGPHQEIPGRTLHKWRGVSVVLVSHLPPTSSHPGPTHPWLHEDCHGTICYAHSKGEALACEMVRVGSRLAMMWVPREVVKLTCHVHGAPQLSVGICSQVCYDSAVVCDDKAPKGAPPGAPVRESVERTPPLPLHCISSTLCLVSYMLLPEVARPRIADVPNHLRDLVADFDVRMYAVFWAVASCRCPPPRCVVTTCPSIARRARTSHQR